MCLNKGGIKDSNSKIHEVLLNAMGRRNLINCIKVLPGLWMEIFELCVRPIALMAPHVDGLRSARRHLWQGLIHRHCLLVYQWKLLPL